MDVLTILIGATIGTVVSGGVAGLVWLVQLKPVVIGLRHDLDELTGKFAVHKENGEIHFNQRLSAEVDRRNEQRFVTIEQQLSSINSKLDRIASK